MLTHTYAGTHPRAYLLLVVFLRRTLTNTPPASTSAFLEVSSQLSSQAVGFYLWGRGGAEAWVWLVFSLLQTGPLTCTHAIEFVLCFAFCTVYDAQSSKMTDSQGKKKFSIPALKRHSSNFNKGWSKKIFRLIRLTRMCLFLKLSG